MENIAHKFSNLSTRQDLLNLLNEVKVEDLGEKAHPFTLGQIMYYADPRTDRKRYGGFSIPKKSGGLREISAPVRGLKNILHYLNKILSEVYTPDEYAKGFVKGLSVVDNAKVHVGQNYVFNIDLKDFFPSIEKSRVWKRLTLPPFNLTSDMADIIAGLCTMKVADGDKARYVLPQGAPTSPIISNMVCQNLDRKLGGLARRFGLRYTRYADDITFSSTHNIYAADGDFMKELRRIIAEQKFTVNEQKTRLQTHRQRQEVTGLVVSEKVNVPRKYVRDLRQLLYIWKRYGIAIAVTRMQEHYDWNKHICCRIPSLGTMVTGKLQYLKMIRGANDRTYLRLLEDFDVLKDRSAKKDNYASAYIFRHTYTKEEFERQVRSEIFVTELSGKYAYAFFNVSDDHIALANFSKAISRKTRLLLARGSEAEKAAIWRDLRISLCQYKSNYPLYKCCEKREFFLIHRQLRKKMVSVTEPVHPGDDEIA